MRSFTVDADDAFARFNDEELLAPTQAIDAVDSTGAGDAYLAEFVVARKRGLSVSKALAVGNVVSGAVIQYVGARLPIKIDVPVGLCRMPFKLLKVLAVKFNSHE